MNWRFFSKDRHGAESARSSKSTLLPCSASRIIFSCDDQPRPWRNSEYRVGSWICGRAQCSCLHCVESTSCEHLPSLCALNLPAHELPSRKPRQGLWNLSSTKLLVSKAVRLQGKAFSESLRKNAPADIVREFGRASPVIFPGRNYRWLMKMQPLMPRRLVATHVAQAARKIRCRGN